MDKTLEVGAPTSNNERLISWLKLFDQMREQAYDKGYNIEGMNEILRKQIEHMIEMLTL